MLFPGVKSAFIVSKPHQNRFSRCFFEMFEIKARKTLFHIFFSARKSTISFSGRLVRIIPPTRANVCPLMLNVHCHASAYKHTQLMHAAGLDFLCGLTSIQHSHGGQLGLSPCSDRSRCPSRLRPWCTFIQADTPSARTQPSNSPGKGNSVSPTAHLTALFFSFFFFLSRVRRFTAKLGHHF